MKRKTLFHRFSRKLAMIILTGALLLSGCASSGNTTAETGSAASETSKETQVQSNSYGSAAASAQVTTLDVSDMFSDRDLKTEYEEKDCVLITLNGKEATCESSAVSVEDGVIVIKEAGSYILRGSYQGSIRVEAPEDAKVQLILDGAELKAEATAAIYGKTADKIFLTMSEGSSNVIKNTGEFQAIDENNIDGAIYSKCDLTLNGNGKLTVSSEKGHGIVSKDDLKITSGTYEITAGDHGISGKDSIRIADGTINITSTEDGLHSGNDEDADKGYVYVANGNITISAGDDGIHGETKVVIGGGTINITKSNEGIEGAILEIAGGDISVVANDDGLNVSDGSGTESFGPGGFGGFGQNNSTSGNTADIYVLITGGRIVVDAQGDGIDANGALYVKGGEIYVTGPENNGNGALDYDSTGEITGGSLIAIGASGMSMNFSNATQGSALITTSSTHKAGEKVVLTDSDSNEILSVTATRGFNSVVVSSPLMKQGGTYTLTIGSETQTFTLEQLIYGQSQGFGGFGGGQRPGRPDGENGQGDGQRPEGGGRTRPGNGEGFDGNFEGMPQMPEGFDGNFEGMPQMPGGSGGRPGNDQQGSEEDSGT
ncbi:MAG: carbohydrate-binding domain-containing protein [Lachnospiraceae bacterium]|nr:carbohydrate-binding domain-containing protein [Lachnospiraceae bacterium]